MRHLALLTLLALTACDADGDGLVNEGKWGTDPQNPDSDNDGMLDGDEVDANLDPADPDMDLDGYYDGDEVAVGTDPLDAESVIYTGGWPYNRHKDDYNPVIGVEGRFETGAPTARFVTNDQYGEPVDLYDFIGHGKPVVIDIAGEWCGPCHAMSDWLGGTSYREFASYNGVRAAVDQGDVIWVTVLAQNGRGGNPAQANVSRWAEDYEHPLVPVLQDTEDIQIESYFRVTSWPALVFIDADGVVVKKGNSWYNTMDEVASWVGDNVELQ